MERFTYRYMAKRTVIDRFWDKVKKAGADDCWIWTAARAGPAYGVFGVSGRMVYAHRLSWELSNGPIPEAMSVLHRCDVPLCVNPSHLFIGTQADNLHDMYAKSRGAIGERHGGAKLSAQEVAAMRKLRIEEKIIYEILGEMFGVSKSQAHRICSGSRWRP